MSLILRFELIIWLKVSLSLLLQISVYNLGWNHRFNRLVAKYHSNIWHLFECLKREEVAVRQQMLKILTGVQKKKNKAVAMLQQRISTLQSQFDENNISLAELLEGLSLLVGTSK